jgi:hypothetical protein
MKERRFILLFLPLIAFLLTAFLSFHQAQAGTEHNIRGLASSSMGYISFNCLDDDFFGKFPMIFPFYFNVSPCSVSQHGVHLDDDNNLSGSAWSPAVGYIHFDSSSTPLALDYSFNVNCPNTCDSSNNCIACYNTTTQQVYGWGYRNASGGQWIDLDSESPPVTMINYDNPQPGIFAGYADSPFGQISFNCLTDNTCGINDYKVYMWKLELQEMSAPNWSFAQACSFGVARRVSFEWLRKSGTQTAYRVVANTVNNTSTPIFDSGELSGSASQLVCPSLNCDWTPNYNTSYYWWLQLRNENGEWTEMFQFNRDTYGTLTDNIDYNNDVSPASRLTFTTYKHEFPYPFFVMPPEILVGTSTPFVSDSSYYTTANPNSNAQPCLEGGDCDFLWSVSNPATASIDEPTAHTTNITFSDITPQIVTLSITDPDKYVCSYSANTMTINFQLPIWREVKAQ